MIDRDHNGSLSKAELMEAFGGCNYEVYRQILEEFDTNHDGQISKQEFKMAMKGLLKK
jgi:calcium-dependent protein kinase